MTKKNSRKIAKFLVFGGFSSVEALKCVCPIKNSKIALSPLWIFCILHGNHGQPGLLCIRQLKQTL